MTSKCNKCGSDWIRPVPLIAGARKFECSNHKCRNRVLQKTRKSKK